MKVLVALQYEDSEGKMQVGRKAWLGKVRNARTDCLDLSLSTIYTTEETACDTISEIDLINLKRLNEQAIGSKIVILSIIGRNMTHPIMARRKHKEYGFEVMFYDINMAVKTKAHTPQHFGNEHFAIEVGQCSWWSIKHTNTEHWVEI